MSRAPKITIEEVADTVSKLLAQGEKITIAKVREGLDGRGSPATISKMLKEMKTQSRGDSQAKAEQTPSPTGQVADHQAQIERQEQSAENNVHVSQPVEHAEGQHVSADKKDSREHNKQSKNHGQNDQRGNHRDKGQNQNKQKHQNDRKSNNNGKSNNNNYDRNRKKRYEEITEQMSGAFGEYYYVANLDTLDEEALKTNIRRLETCLNKEQSRRVMAEQLAQESKEYAESIKEQVAQRINDLRQLMEERIEQLKAEAKALRAQTEADLDFYRQQLNKANDKLLQLSQSS